MPDSSLPPLAVVCRACGYPSAASVAGKITVEDEEEGVPFELSLIQCEHCESPSLIRQDEASEAAPVEVWPTSPRTLHAAIPQNIREGVTEARKCFEAGAFLATTVMVRRVLEGFSADHGVSHKKTLHRALQELVECDVIDARLLEWADGLRLLGNVGAHFTDEMVTKQDASDALDLIEAMLDYVYVFSAKFEQFKARRDEQATPKSRRLTRKLNSGTYLVVPASASWNRDLSCQTSDVRPMPG